MDFTITAYDSDRVSPNKLATDYVQIHRGGAYAIDFMFKVEDDPEVPKSFCRYIVARAMVETDSSPWVECRWTKRYAEDFESLSYTAVADSIAQLTLEVGQRVWVELEGYGVDFIPETDINAELKYADGYDYLDNLEPVYPSVGSGLAGDQDMTLDLGQVYYDGDCIAIFEPGDQNIISLYNDGEERIRINCATGEINFKPDMKDEYKQMWLELSRTFPQAFNQVQPIHETEEIEEREPTSSDFDRAMELLK